MSSLSTVNELLCLLTARIWIKLKGVDLLTHSYLTVITEPNLLPSFFAHPPNPGSLLHDCFTLLILVQPLSTGAFWGCFGFLLFIFESCLSLMKAMSFDFPFAA